MFIYNSIGYLILYFPARTLIKHISQELIKENRIDQEKLIVLAFKISDLKSNKYDLIWEKPDKEFRFEGDMYDVEKTYVDGDSVYYTCYCDHTENILEEIFALQFSDHKKDKTQNTAQRIVFISVYSEQLDDLNTKIYNQTTTNFPFQATEAGLLDNQYDVPTPPPKFMCG